MMYNPTTKAIVESRDVVWTDWEQLDPKADVSVYDKDPPTSNESQGIDAKEAEENPPPTTTPVGRSTRRPSREEWRRRFART